MDELNEMSTLKYLYKIFISLILRDLAQIIRENLHFAFDTI